MTVAVHSASCTVLTTYAFGNIYLHTDQFYNFEGHELKFIAALYFPYIEFQASSDQPLTPVVPMDSLDVRLADTFSKKLNFT